MTLRTPLPISKWQLLQVGYALAPQWGAQSELSYEPVHATEVMASGATYDFNRNRRAPLQPGALSHSGLYRCCGEPCGCGWSMTEVDLIQMNKGVYTPMLFVRDYTKLPPQPDLCYITPVCVTYAWAYGKVMKVSAPFSVDDYLSQDVVEISLEATIETPLREITYERWRYGRALTPSVINRVDLRFFMGPSGEGGSTVLERPLLGPSSETALLSELEILKAEPKAEWYIPCDYPPTCTDERFWPRDLNPVSDDHKFELANLGAAAGVSYAAPTRRRLRVNGNHPPLLQGILRGDTRIRIINAVSDKIYTFPVTAGAMVYFNTATGECLQKISGVVSPLPGVTDLPMLEPVENVIEVEQGIISLGITPQWIN